MTCSEVISCINMVKLVMVCIWSVELYHWIIQIRLCSACSFSSCSPWLQACSLSTGCFTAQPLPSTFPVPCQHHCFALKTSSSTAQTKDTPPSIHLLLKSSSQVFTDLWVVFVRFLWGGSGHIACYWNRAKLHPELHIWALIKLHFT